MGGDEFMEMNELINLIVNNSFAVAVSAYCVTCF